MSDLKGFEEVIKNIVGDIIASGSIEEKIKETINKSIESSIEESFRSYSDFGKIIKDKVSQSIQSAGRDIEIPQYNRFVADVVQEQYENLLHENALTHLRELIGAQIQPVTKISNFSTLIDRIQHHYEDEFGLNDQEYIRIEQETSENCIKATIKNHYDEETEVTFYNFGSDEGLYFIGYIKIDGSPVTGNALRVAAKHLDGFQKELFQYYAMGTKFEADQELCDIYLQDY